MALKYKPDISNYFKRSNVKRFIIFFVISFLFLLFSKFSNDYSQIIILKPKLENLDDEVILKNIDTKSIEVRVEGKGFTLVPFIFDNIKTLEIDTKKNIKVADSAVSVEPSSTITISKLSSPLKFRKLSKSSLISMGLL